MLDQSTLCFGTNKYCYYRSETGEYRGFWDSGLLTVVDLNKRKQKKQIKTGLGSIDGIAPVDKKNVLVWSLGSKNFVHLLIVVKVSKHFLAIQRGFLLLFLLIKYIYYRQAMIDR